MPPDPGCGDPAGIVQFLEHTRKTAWIYFYCAWAHFVHTEYFFTFGSAVAVDDEDEDEKC